MKSNVEKILDFMQLMERVCLVKRDTLLSDGTAERDSSHIFKLSFFIMLVYPYLKKKYNYEKLLELALVHDIVEGITGDCPRSAQIAHPERQIEKQKRETEAIEYYRSVLPSPLNEKIYDLFLEYEKKETPEAKLVSALDKLEANYQANRYGDGDIRYWQNCENGEEYYKIATSPKAIVSEINEEILTLLEQKVIKLTLENMKKCQIKP